MLWLLFCILSWTMAANAQYPCNLRDENNDVANTRSCMYNVSGHLDGGNISLLKDFEETLVSTNLQKQQSLSLSEGHFVAYVFKNSFSSTPFEGLTIYVNMTQATTEIPPNMVATVQLPKELPVKRTHKFALNMVSLPPKAASVLASPYNLYENRMLGLIVERKTVLGLNEFVNISLNVTKSIPDNHRPQCVFLNYTANSTLETDGCWTQWNPGQSKIICSCNHLTFFGVLLIPNEAAVTVPEADKMILTYITFVGCCISFSAIVIAVLLFTLKRSIHSDVSMKIHVNLAIALLFLNMHLLPSTAQGIWKFSWPSPWLCFYLALALHFSLMASFSWMALEGFHLYLLLVRVFNIYVKKYLLKLSFVGWGIPAVIVSIVVTINQHAYGFASVSNTTGICFIDNDLIKYVTVLGLFCLMFLFNLIMFIVTIRNIVVMRKSKQFGPNDCNRAKKDICTLLGVITLLGTTWGLIFFSFGQITTIGLYAFSILNPLQGLFIFIWFVMTARKIGKSTTTSTATTQSSVG